MFEELSLHILDIAMNSVTAGARTVQIMVGEHARRDQLALRIQDDGCGMDTAMLERVLVAPVSTKRHRRKGIGLGLAMLRQTTEMCDGDFQLRSAPGSGTTVTASMKLSHVDRPPLGDLNATILALCAANPAVDVQLHYLSDTEHFHFSSKELAEKKSISRPGNPAGGGEKHHYEPERTQTVERKGAAAGRLA